VAKEELGKNMRAKQKKRPDNIAMRNKKDKRKGWRWEWEEQGRRMFGSPLGISRLYSRAGVSM